MGPIFCGVGIKLDANVAGNFPHIVRCLGWEYNDPCTLPQTNGEFIPQNWLDWKMNISFGPILAGELLVLGSVTHNSVGEGWRWILRNFEERYLLCFWVGNLKRSWRSVHIYVLSYLMSHEFMIVFFWEHAWLTWFLSNLLSRRWCLF